jgi:hypothetical protein
MGERFKFSSWFLLFSHNDYYRRSTSRSLGISLPKIHSSLEPQILSLSLFFKGKKHRPIQVLRRMTHF